MIDSKLPMQTSPTKAVPRLLTIAGSDSGGGAGLQADLKTFSALAGYGMSVVTAITAQNTTEVRAIHELPVALIESQIAAVVEDIGVDAVKLGMLSHPDVIVAVAAALKKYGLRNIVIDPVMVSKSGDKLLRDEAVSALRELLIPLATVLTPNLPEAEILTRQSVTTQNEMRRAAATLIASGAENVVLKGGHLAGDVSPDLFLSRHTPEADEWFPSQRVESRNTHGTGCTFSAAVAAYLGHGLSAREAVQQAKTYITQAIIGSAEWQLGHGHGPVHHFYRWW